MPAGNTPAGFLRAAPRGPAGTLMTQSQNFSIAEALRAQKALRDTLGLGEEHFDVRALVGMLSEEIEKMRAAGQSDEKIAALIQRATGKPLSAAEIAQNYAPADQRRR